MVKMTSESNDLVEAEIAKQLKYYDGRDDELSNELKLHGLGHVPLTSHTRMMLLRKLVEKSLNLECKNENLHTDAQDVTSSADKSEDESVSERSVSLGEDQNKTHYAICIPGPDDQILIENDLLEVLKKMKEHTKKKPRMIMFSNLSEAKLFSERASANDVCQGAIVKSNYPKEKAEREVNEPVTLPSVPTPQLNQLRVLLEKGQVAVARQLILTNPRYLIGTGDVPTILKIGPRYNALHASAFVGQLESCRLILDLLCDTQFLKIMYSTQKRSEEYSARLVDLHLNTPDKMASKTPLHIASERGHVEIVAFFVSFRVCNRTNSQQEIACSKYDGPDKAEIKRRIINLIKDGTCYVPLVRSDTTGPYAKVAKPFSPSSPHHLVEEIEESLKSSPSNTTQDMKDFSNLKLWAAAGPMSPQEAQEFRRDWWSPRTRRKEIHQKEPFLNITDGERGFEHYGRKLADSHDVAWQEYWPFLDAFVDMRSLEGLKKLEDFLSRQRVIVKYEGLQGKVAACVPSEPFKIFKDFIIECEKSLNSEDSDSFVSANDYDPVSEDKRLKEQSNILEKDNSEAVTFHECTESLVGDNFYITGRNDQGDSPLQKLWNGLRSLIFPKLYSNSPENNHSTTSSSQVSHPLHHKEDKSKTNRVNSKPSKDSSSDVNCNENVTSSTENKDSVQGESSNVNKTDHQVRLESLSSMKQDLELSSVYETSAADAPISEFQEQRSSLHIDSSIFGRETPLTSTPVKEWSYREVVPVISSPDEEGSNGNGEEPVTGEKEEGTGNESLVKKEESPEKTAKNENSSSNEDDSFRTKMNFLCQGLEKFQIQSPPTSSTAEMCIIDRVETSKDDEKQNSTVPSLSIFTEMPYAQFIAEFDSKLSKPDSDSDIKRAILPVLMLRQGSEDCILGDIYLPVASDPNSNGMMDEAKQKELHGNVWLNFIVSFQSLSDANKFVSLQGSETTDVRVVGMERDKDCGIRMNDFHLSRLKEAYFDSRKCSESECPNIESCSTMIQCKVVRSCTIPSKDIYICGTIPTKVDGDVYRAFNDKTVQLIDKTTELSAVCEWLTRMKMNGKDAIESLPSPSRILRTSLQRQGSLPLSPLVKNEHPMRSKTFVQSPCSSKIGNEDRVPKKLF